MQMNSMSRLKMKTLYQTLTVILNDFSLLLFAEKFHDFGNRWRRQQSDSYGGTSWHFLIKRKVRQDGENVGYKEIEKNSVFSAPYLTHD